MIFLKLGGSLITLKGESRSARIPTIERLAQEILTFRKNSSERLLIGHGSGSFGHQAALEYGLIDGVYTGDDWDAFKGVWSAAHDLHRIILEILLQHHLPAVSIPPSSACIADGGEIVAYFTEPLLRAAEAELIPMVMGDIVFDRSRGGSIVSTEEVFLHLAPLLQPSRVLLLGREPGVYADYPTRSKLLEILDREAMEEITLRGSASTDVTGGMLSKVGHAMAIARLLPDADVLISSAEKPGDLLSILQGSCQGTLVKAH